MDADGFKNIYNCGVFETCMPVAFEKEDKQVYVMTNKGDPNRISLSLLDPQTGATRLVESDPLKRVDCSGPMVSEVTHEIVAIL